MIIHEEHTIKNFDKVFVPDQSFTPPRRVLITDTNPVTVTNVKPGDFVFCLDANRNVTWNPNKIQTAWVVVDNEYLGVPTKVTTHPANKTEWIYLGIHEGILKDLQTRHGKDLTPPVYEKSSHVYTCHYENFREILLSYIPKLKFYKGRGNNPIRLYLHDDEKEYIFELPFISFEIRPERWNFSEKQWEEIKQLLFQLVTTYEDIKTQGSLGSYYELVQYNEALSIPKRHYDPETEHRLKESSIQLIQKRFVYCPSHQWVFIMDDYYSDIFLRFECHWCVKEGVYEIPCNVQYVSRRRDNQLYGDAITPKVILDHPDILFLF